MSDIFKYVDKNNSTAELIKDKNQIKQCHITDDFPKIPKFEKGGICGVKTQSVYSDCSEIDEMNDIDLKKIKDKIKEQKNEISILKSLIDNYRDAESKLFDENKELKKQVERLRKDNVKLADALTYEIERKSNEIKNTQVHPDLEWYEKRIDDDSIEINKLNTTIDVLIHRCEYLRQMAGLE